MTKHKGGNIVWWVLSIVEFESHMNEPMLRRSGSVSVRTGPKIALLAGSRHVGALHLCTKYTDCSAIGMKLRFIKKYNCVIYQSEVLYARCCSCGGRDDDSCIPRYAWGWPQHFVQEQALAPQSPFTFHEKKKLTNNSMLMYIVLCLARFNVTFSPRHVCGAWRIMRPAESISPFKLL